MNTDLINEHLPEYLRRIGHELVQEGSRWKCLCPLHEEKSPSFFVDQSKGVWLARCFGCDWGGNLIGLHAARTGRDPHKQFLPITTELTNLFDLPLLQGIVRIPKHSRKAGRSIDRDKIREECLKKAAASHLDEILHRYGSSEWRADLWEDSPYRLNCPTEDDTRLFLKKLFLDDDFVFIGEPWHSGKGKGEGHFRPVSEWLDLSNIPRQRIAPSIFHPGTIARTRESVKERKFLVMESDDLIGRKPVNWKECEANKAACNAIFRWCVKVLGLRLVAVIDTGHRSLHGWFEMPGHPRMLQELQEIGPSLRLDPNLFTNITAPLRLPGCVHQETKYPATLLYLNPMTSP